jgi:ATP-binding cassette, subfamily B, bacterial
LNSESEEKPLRSTLSRPLLAIGLVWRSSRGWTLVNLALLVVQGLLPLASLFVMKQIVDVVASGVRGADKTMAYHSLWTWIALAAALAVLAAICRALGELATQAQSLSVTDEVASTLHAQSVAVDLEYYEDPSYHDTLHRAQREAAFRPTRIVQGVAQIAQNGISLLGLAGLLLSYNWMIGCALLLVALPASAARVAYSRKLYRLERGQTELDRKAWYFNLILTGAGFAKEIRVFRLGEDFRRRFSELRQHLRVTKISLLRRRTLADASAQILATAALFAALAFIASQALAGVITIGALVMYYQGFISGLGFLQSVLRGTAGLYEDSLFLGDYQRFLELQPSICSPRDPAQPPALLREGIKLEGVGFHYPGRQQEVLQGIDLTFKPGQVTAIVGENGSGKTSLIKLVCRLYDPSEGRIMVEGVDLRQMDPARWRRDLAVLFQDYAHYQLTLRETLTLGSMEERLSDERILRAAEQAGLDPLILRLPEGLDTPLGRWFRQGEELSQGEWQRVSLARAFLRDVGILVLDEPSSALDPLAEADLLQRFRDLVRGRCTILVSHRLSTVQLADCVVVLQSGRILERGTHQDLLAAGGVYARMYGSQAGRYR